MTASNVATWTSTGYSRIVGLAGAQAGLTFPENRREITEAAIRRAMAHAGFKDADAFADRMITDPAALNAALTELTIGETYFFRDPGQWELVRREIVPELLRRHDDQRGVRVWSAGCASGEEAYTLGIVLSDAGCISPLVIGTDLCEHRLSRATRAIYTKWSMRGMDAVANHRYFRERGQHFHLRPEYRNARFRPLNLVEREYGQPGQELSELDLILCRNVLIYIEPVLLDSIFERLTGALRDGGWLIVAASDPQPSSSLPLDVVVTEAGLLYRKRSLAISVKLNKESTPAYRWATPSSTAPSVAPPPMPPPATIRAVAPPAPARSVVPITRVADADLAMQAYRTADYARAISFANESIRAGRDTALTWILLVRSHANRGELSDATRCCALAVARFPDEAELYVVDSAIEAQRERFAASADAARRAVYLDRTLAVAQLSLGTALLRLGDNVAADRALRAAERMLADRPPVEVVPASDGALVTGMLSATRAHRALLERRGSHAS